MYDWRRMTPAERRAVLELRQKNGLPWHSPPHFDLEGENQYLISAACYEHAPVIGKSPERMAECERDMLTICREIASDLFAWCILPNHDHILLQTDRMSELRGRLGRFHGRSSYQWNGEDGTRGRQVWHNCTERAMRSERHFWASLNYVHHNAVHHGYVKRWEDWPFSSAPDFLERVGRKKAMEIWKRYPVLDYGKKWDV